MKFIRLKIIASGLATVIMTVLTIPSFAAKSSEKIPPPVTPSVKETPKNGLKQFYGKTKRKTRTVRGMDVSKLKFKAQRVKDPKDPKVTRELQPYTGKFGIQHTRLQQYYHDIPIFGAQVVKHVKDSKVFYTGRVAKLKGLNHKPKLSAEQALKSVSTWLPNTAVLNASLVIYPTDSGEKLAYWLEENEIDSQWQVFVDAKTGDILNAYNNIQYGTGVGIHQDTKTVDSTLIDGVYYLKSADGYRETYDGKRRNRLPGTLMTDADDQWEDGAAVDAHYYTSLVVKFYQDVYGRDSFDNNGALIKSTVHYGRDFMNVYWNGSQAVYGDADGIRGLPYSGALDTVMHELTHAVTAYTSALVYQGQSGALNEAFSDIMGAAIEYTYQRDKFDWMIGEDTWLENGVGVGWRWMDNPTKDEWSSDHMDNLYTGTADNGGVHGNSGIPNVVFVLLVDGGQHPRVNSYPGPTVAALGMETARDIFYYAFTDYLTADATFADARIATEMVALNYSTQAAQAVADAWTAVGVMGEVPPPNGDEEIQLNPGESFASTHPYENNQTIIWNYTNAGAKSVTVNFAALDLQRNMDYVYVMDGNSKIAATFTGKYKRKPKVTVSGDTLKVSLVTDASTTAYGFDAQVQ